MTTIPPPGPLRRFWRSLGPGVVTGAADDDPSGIATYSIAGAQLGTALLWMALVTWPLMLAVQAMCARIGMVTGHGLMAALRSKFPKPVLVVGAAALFIANTINIGADLAGMADAAELLTGVTSHVWVFVFGFAIVWTTIRFRYAKMANVLKWLALVLFVYVIAMFQSRPPWREVAHAVLLPSPPASAAAWATIVAILGTTISPYLFFWQASQEVEEEKAKGRATVAARRGATSKEIRTRAIDVGVGTLVSNVVMFAIILTTAMTLHRSGMTAPSTSKEVAQALEPLAGRLAVLLYSIGLIGTGFLAIPTLAGSAAYAFAQTFAWREGMDQQFRQAPAFYSIVGLSVAGGVLLDFANISAVQALYWSAVVNGLLAPVILAGILLVASDREVMQGQPSSWAGRLLVGATTVAMTVAAVAMFVM